MLSSKELVTLGEVCQFVGGGTPARERPDFYSGDIPWATVKDFKTSTIIDTQEHVTQEAIDRSASNIVEQGTVLLVTRVGLGKVAMAGRRLAINQDVKGLTPREDVLPEYLFWFLVAIAPKIERMGVGATVKGVTLQDVKAIKIPLPNKEVQRRIVDLLSRAENIVRMRQEAEKKAKEIIPALFLDMFGDPARNPKGWPTQTFRDLGTLDRGRSRHRPRDAPHLYGGPHPFVQTGDVARSGGVITTYTQTYSDAGLAQSRLWPVGTLCITIAANIAETGVLAFEACFPDSVVGFLPGESIRTDYIQHWLHFLKPTLAAQAPQAAQKNINLEILRNLNVPVPPISLQVVFEEYAKRLRSTEASQLAATTVGAQVFQSLLAGVFSEGVAI